MNRRAFLRMMGVTPVLPLVGSPQQASEPNLIELADTGALGGVKLFPAQQLGERRYALEYGARV